MEKTTKNEITREQIQNELLFYNKADIKTTLVLAFFLIPLGVGLSAGFVALVTSIFAHTFFTILLCAFFCLLFGIPAFMTLLGCITLFRERKMISRGAFAVVTRSLSYKSEKYERYGRPQFKELLHFPEFDEKAVAHVTYETASSGDEYYLVHCLGKTEIKLLYATKIYEYKEKANF